MRLDHVSYAAGSDDLVVTVQRIGAQLGVGLYDGGIHPRFGTRNFVLPLAGGRYLEVVGVLDHPAADTAPFGRAVKACSVRGGGWLAWVVSTDDLGPVAERLGRTPVQGDRHLPDGTRLRWQQVGVLDVISEPQLPFFIRWDLDVPHPSSGPGAGRIVGMELAGERAPVVERLGATEREVMPDVRVDWVDAARSGLLAVDIETTRGVVRVE